MPEVLTAGKIYDVLPGTIITPAVSFDNFLESGELLTGSVTVTKQNLTSDLTIANEARGSTTKTIDGVSVIADRWVSFRVTVAASPTAGKHYLTVGCATDSSPAQNPIVRVILNVKSLAADD